MGQLHRYSSSNRPDQQSHRSGETTGVPLSEGAEVQGVDVVEKYKKVVATTKSGTRLLAEVGKVVGRSTFLLSFPDPNKRREYLLFRDEQNADSASNGYIIPRIHGKFEYNGTSYLWIGVVGGIEEGGITKEGIFHSLPLEPVNLKGDNTAPGEVAIGVARQVEAIRDFH